MKKKNKKLIRNFLSRRDNNRALFWSLLTLVICFIMSHLYWNPLFKVNHFLAASPYNVFEQKEYWRLFTSSFIHADFNHFLSNSLMLTIMGYFVNYHFGTIVYPIFGFVSGIFINLFVIWDHTGNWTLVGASGVVHYLWGFWFITYILIQSHIALNRRLMKVIAVGIFILVPTEFKANVSYLAHGIGIILGCFTGFLYFIVNRKKIKSYEVWKEIEEVVDEDLAMEAMTIDIKEYQ